MDSSFKLLPQRESESQTIPTEDMKKADRVHALDVGIFNLKYREFPHVTLHLQIIPILVSQMYFLFLKIESNISKVLF